MSEQRSAAIILPTPNVVFLSSGIIAPVCGGEDIIERWDDNSHAQNRRTQKRKRLPLRALLMYLLLCTVVMSGVTFSKYVSTAKGYNGTIDANQSNDGQEYKFNGANPDLNRGWADMRPQSGANFIYTLDNITRNVAGRSSDWISFGPLNTTGNLTCNITNCNITQTYLDGGSHYIRKKAYVQNITLNIENSTLQELHTEFYDTREKGIAINGAFELNLMNMAPELPNLTANSEAYLELIEGGKLTIAGEVKGTAEVKGGSYTITALTESVEYDPTKDAFTAEDIIYETSGANSIWKKGKEYTGILDAVYVSDAGDDTNEGRKSDPVRTLAKAYEIVKPNGYIVVCGEVSFTAWPTIPKKVTITSDDRIAGVTDGQDYRKSGAKLSFAPTPVESNYITLTVGERTDYTYVDGKAPDVTFIK